MLKDLLPIFFAVPLITLSGCAQVTPKVTSIDENVFQIRTTVYGGWRISLDNSPEGIMNATLTAAATEANRIGCSYFAAIANDEQRLNLPSEQVTDGLARISDGSVVYRNTSGQVYKVVKPNSRGNTFVCFKDRPTALVPGLVFNSRFVLDSQTRN